MKKITIKQLFECEKIKVIQIEIDRSFIVVVDRNNSLSVIVSLSISLFSPLLYILYCKTCFFSFLSLFLLKLFFIFLFLNNSIFYFLWFFSLSLYSIWLFKKKLNTNTKLNFTCAENTLEFKKFNLYIFEKKTITNKTKQILIFSFFLFYFVKLANTLKRWNFYIRVRGLDGS